MYDHAAAQRAQHLAYWSDAVADGHGVWRWDASGNCPFDDVLAVWEEEGLIDAAARAATNAARNADSSRHMAQYRAARANGPTAAERAAARAAHGPGVTLVDVITGHRYTT